MRRLSVIVLLAVGAFGTWLVNCADDTSVSALAEPDAAAGTDDAADGVDGALIDAGTDGDADVAARAPLVDTCGDAGVVPGAWVVDPHMCLTVFVDTGLLSTARQIAFAPNGDLFIGAGYVVIVFDHNHDGVIGPGESSQFVGDLPGLNHGVALSPDGAFVYASSPTTVYRWAYRLGDLVHTNPPEIVVVNIPGGGHDTRTLAFDSAGRLYVNVGSANDVDTLPTDIASRGQVRRFAIPAGVPDGGIDYDAGEVYASGLRNEVGLAFDSKGRFWGVENGSDGAYQAVDNLDNPAEELNRLDAPGARAYGYPYCWSEFAFDGGLGPRTQWAYIETPNPETDAWCRDTANVQPPIAAMQGHWAPLGVAEYTGGSLPWKGDLFVASHGSSGRTPPVGRLVARAHLVGDNVTTVTPIAGHLVDGGLEEGTWDARPVDIATGPDGALYFSDDNMRRIFRLGYKP